MQENNSSTTGYTNTIRDKTRKGRGQLFNTSNSSTITRDPESALFEKVVMKCPHCGFVYAVVNVSDESAVVNVPGGELVVTITEHEVTFAGDHIDGLNGKAAGPIVVINVVPALILPSGDDIFGTLFGVGSGSKSYWGENGYWM